MTHQMPLLPRLHPAFWLRSEGLAIPNGITARSITASRTPSCRYARLPQVIQSG